MSRNGSVIIQILFEENLPYFMLIEANALKHWMDHFYGYGSWRAKIWFVSHEEGGGDLPEDIVISGGVVSLRAERAPSGKGRTYTIFATATDIAGNATTLTATCSAPK